MKKIVLVSTVFVLLLGLLSFTGCAGNPESAAPAPVAGAQAPAAAEPAAPATQDNDPEPEEHTEIIEFTYVHVISGRPVPPGQAEVDAAINEILEAEHGLRMNRLIIELGNWSEQKSAMLMAREPIDLIGNSPHAGTSFSVMAPQGHFTPLDDLIQRYGQGIIQTLGPILDAGRVGDVLYGVPNHRILVTRQYLFMRQDILEELDLFEFAQNAQSLEDLEVIFTAVRDYTDLFPLGAGVLGDVKLNNFTFAEGNNFSDWTVHDPLGDSLHIIQALPGNRVVNHFATDNFRRQFEITRDWMERGFIHPDVAIIGEHPAFYIRNNLAFGYFVGTEIGGTLNHSILSETEMFPLFIAPGTGITTGFARNWSHSIPSASREPEAGMQFLNLAFTDPVIADLLFIGLEGRDYVIAPDGTAAFPEGIDSGTVPYRTNDHVLPHQLIMRPVYGQYPNLRDLGRAENERIGPTPFLGFAADLSEIQHEIIAVSGVVDQFRTQIISGTAGPEVLDEFLSRLEAVGVNRIVDEYQRQLDEWLAGR